ncbi:MAG: hypothetical protein J1E16_00495 [Muribaculaceae bacterium]|nr:hypothetical protein [Muribaculaceae bacterium]
MLQYKDNPPYSLFQGPDSKWGTKDKDGKVHNKPIYIQSTKPGKENFFHDEAGLEIVEFDENEGMELVAWWSEPWYEMAWIVADYPERFNHYIVNNINGLRKLGLDDQNIINQIAIKTDLSEKQKSLFDLFNLFLEMEDENTDDKKFDMIEPFILSHSMKSLNCNERMELIIPIIETKDLIEEEKSTLWYTLFKLNDYLSCQ